MKKTLCLALALSPFFSGTASTERPICEFAKEYLAKDLKLKIECQDSYLIYCQDNAANQLNGCTAKISKNTDRPLKLAGFNVYNLGMEQDMKGNKLTVFKNLKILAEVIGQFDVTGSIEMKHLAKEDVLYNNALVKAPRSNLPFRIPAYLEVLRSLQSKDPSWTLIMSPDLFNVNPEDTLNNELAAFYYKRSEVDLVETEYCKTFACAVPKKEFNSEVARTPFLASFKSGKLDFTMAVVHFRYRYPSLKGVLNKAMYDSMMKVYDFEKHTGYVFDPKIKAQQEEKYETSSRFSEVKNVGNFLGRLIATSKRKDVILYGDFNLMAPSSDSALPLRKKEADMTSAFKLAWFDKKGVLENFSGSEPYINKTSTVGKEGLVSEFDHFVFAKNGSLKGCDSANGDIFNFTDRDIFSRGDEMIKVLDLQTFKDSIKAEMKFDKAKVVPRYSTGKLGFLAIGYQKNVLDSYQKGTLDVYKELISDHLPIYMNCAR